ncbi:MAG: hypothetical protein ACOZF0_05570 [Thermodesulfobacteriota bacterium]
MTSLAHTLVGSSIALLCMPVMEKARLRLMFMGAMIAVANLPDWPIPGWGHFRLDISHSIIANGGLMLCLLVTWRILAGSLFGKCRPVAVGVLAAWMSHLLLDTLYVDSSLAIFWPVSAAGVSLPVPWLKTLPHVPPPFDHQIQRILMLETFTFLPLVILAAAMRLRCRVGRKIPLFI